MSSRNFVELPLKFLVPATDSRIVTDDLLLSCWSVSCEISADCMPRIFRKAGLPSPAPPPALFAVRPTPPPARAHPREPRQWLAAEHLVCHFPGGGPGRSQRC